MPDLRKVQTKYCCNLLRYPERKISLLFMERDCLAEQTKPVVFVFTGVSSPEITAKDKFLGCVGQATKLQVLKAWSTRKQRLANAAGSQHARLLGEWDRAECRAKAYSSLCKLWGTLEVLERLRLVLL